MFGFRTKKDMKVSDVDLSKSRDFTMSNPRYEYSVKVFEEGEEGKVYTAIQNGIKADSDQALVKMFAMCGQKIQILTKKEINQNVGKQIVSSVPSVLSSQEQMNLTNNDVSSVPTTNTNQENTQITRYFTAGGLEFKISGNDVYQKQWIRATDDEYKKIRIVSDSNNKIITLNGKHLEIQHWIKVDSNDTV